MAATSRAHLLDATRAFRAFHQMLLDRELAVSAGAPPVPPRGVVPDDLPMVTARIKASMEAAAEPADLPPKGARPA